MNAQVLNSADYQKRLNLMAFSVSIILGPFVAFIALVWEFKTILIALALITIIAVAFFKRELSVYLVILLIPIGTNFIGLHLHYPWTEHIDLIPFFPWIVLASLAGVLMRKTAEVEEADFTTPVNIFVLAFLTWAFGGVLWAPNLYHTLYYLFILVIEIMMFYLVVVTQRRNEAAHRNMVKMLIACAVILAGLSIWSLYSLDKNITGSYILTDGLTLDYAIKHSESRAKAVSTPNSTGFFLNIAIAFSMGLFLCLKGRLKRTLLLLVIVFLVFGVLASKSKAAVGSLLILGLFFLVAFNSLRAKFTRNTIIFLSVIILLFTMQNIASSRTPRILGSGEMSFTARLQIWERGLHDFIAKAPGWGLGAGGFRYYRDPLPHAHSIYFSTFFDFGIVGILSLAGLIIALIARLLKFIPYQKTYAQMMLVASAGSLLVVLVHGLVDFSYLDHIVWWTLGMATGTILLVEDERRPSTAVIQALNS